jgi:hypothetical protein
MLSAILLFEQKLKSGKYWFKLPLAMVAIIYFAAAAACSYIYRDTSSVKMTIVSVTFFKENPSEFHVTMHLKNQGPPSTVKDCVLVVYVDNKLFQQFPPRELITAPGLGRGMEWQRGLIIGKEPLGSGNEIDAGVTFTVWGNAQEQFGHAGTRFHVIAQDIRGKEMSADYIMH